jgi:hypothetical protein
MKVDKNNPPKRRLSKEEIVDGFLQCRYYLKSDDLDLKSVVVYPDSNENIHSDSIILASYGSGKPPSRESLEALIKDAEEKDCGFSVIPNHGKFS